MSTKTDTPPVQQSELNQNGDCGLSRNEQSSSSAKVVDQSWLSTTISWRFPRVRALLSELRSFRHRIVLLWRRGNTRPLNMGLAYQATDGGSLVPNRRTQSRIRDTQRLLSESRFLSLEDCHLFLCGWDAGWETRDRLDKRDCNYGIPERDSSCQLYTDDRQ